MHPPGGATALLSCSSKGVAKLGFLLVPIVLLSALILVGFEFHLFTFFPVFATFETEMDLRERFVDPLDFRRVVRSSMVSSSSISLAFITQPSGGPLLHSAPQHYHSPKLTLLQTISILLRQTILTLTLPTSTRSLFDSSPTLTTVLDDLRTARIVGGTPKRRRWTREAIGLTSRRWRKEEETASLKRRRSWSRFSREWKRDQ